MRLIYYVLNQSLTPTITVQSSDSESDEDEEIDSDDEDIGPTDFVELIKELANRCSHYENKIDNLRVSLVFKFYFY
jgi:hypothetical protein